MSRIRRSPVFRNSNPPWLEGVVDFDPGSSGEPDNRPMLMNPGARPTTLALDLIEVKHQLGAPQGKTRLTADEWASIFYRGDDLGARQDARLRAFERWKKTVRAAGFDCTADDRVRDPEGSVGRFCVDMSRAIPWAESFLERATQRTTGARRPTARVKTARAGKIVPLYDQPVVRSPSTHAYSKPVGGRVGTSPCTICGALLSAHGDYAGDRKWKARA